MTNAISSQMEVIRGLSLALASIMRFLLLGGKKKSKIKLSLSKEWTFKVLAFTVNNAPRATHDILH